MSWSIARVTAGGVWPSEMAARISCGVSGADPPNSVAHPLAAAATTTAMTADLPRLDALILLIGIFKFLLFDNARPDSSQRQQAAEQLENDPKGEAPVVRKLDREFTRSEEQPSELQSLMRITYT